MVDVTDKTAKGNFPGGKHLVYGLSDKGVAITRGHMTSDAWQAVQDARKNIVSGDVKVPAK